MKEIKFRLRNVQNKTIGYEKWYPGVYNKEQGYSEAKAQWLYSDNNKDWFPKEITHRHKDLYTGFKDKNENEIYENDIIYFEEPVFESEMLNASVEMSEGSWCAKDVRQSKIRWCEISSISEPEIVGDIYKNPELLK